MTQTSDSGRYARITHRLALGAASLDDESSQALAALLQRRVVESIAAECTPLVTSDLLSERTAEAVAALAERGVGLRIGDGALLVDGCFCQSEGCDHAAVLLTRLLGAEIETTITDKGSIALHIVGALDLTRYTQ